MKESKIRCFQTILKPFMNSTDDSIRFVKSSAVHAPKTIKPRGLRKTKTHNGLIPKKSQRDHF